MCVWGAFLFPFETGCQCSSSWPQINYVVKDDLELVDLPASTFQVLGLHTWTSFSLACFCFSFLSFSFSSEKGSISVAQAALEITVLLRLGLLNARIVGMCYCAQLY